MRLLHILVLCVVGLGGCTSSTSPTQNLVIKPLAVGNRWYGRETQYDSSGRFVRAITDTSAITRRFTVAGEDWYVRHDTTNGRSDTRLDRFIFTNRRDGLYESLLRDSATNSILTPSQIAAYPSSVGDTFGTFVITAQVFGGDGVLFYRTAAIDTTVSTAAGRFESCYRYDEYVAWDSTGRIPQRTGGYSIWAPGVGKIRTYSNLPPNYDSDEYELVGFDLK